MFFIPAIILDNPPFASITQCAMSIVLAFLIYSFSKRFINQDIGLLSSFVFLTSPFVTRFGTVPYIDIGATLFCFAAFYTMVVWFKEEKLKYCLLSAIFWGLALSSKYYSILYFFIVALTMMIAYGKKAKLSQFVLMGLISVALAFPWYFRSKLYSGDWFFPLFINKIEKQSFWSWEDYYSHLNHLRSLGVEKNIKSIFLFPINLLTRGNYFDKNLGMIMAIFWMSFLFIKRWTRFTAASVIIIIVYFLIWFYNFQDVRYLLPIFPLLSLLCGWVVRHFFYYVRIMNRHFFICLTIIILVMGITDLVKVIRWKGTFPITEVEKSKYLSKWIPTYKAIQFLNTISEKDAVVYAFLDEGSV
ncbi:MAG: ArnT family glycosyltransferase, partial [Candidatus Omnitrophota bacterium]